jgi:transposase
MARKPQLITLSADELCSLKTSLTKGAAPARVQTRARILDLLHRQHAPSDIAGVLQVGIATVFNIKRRYLAEGLKAALHERPRPGKPCRIDGVARAKITALACSKTPDGHARWTLRLLADKSIELGFVESISHDTVGEVLKKTDSNRTSRSRGALVRSRVNTWRGWKTSCTCITCRLM